MVGSEVDEIDVEFSYHVHSVSSNVLVMISTFCLTFFTSDHFLFFWDGVAEIRMVLFFTVIFTVSLIPLLSSIDFENKMPLEFPMRLTFVMVVAIIPML